MRKMINMAVALVLIAVLLAGCGNGSGGYPDNARNTNPAQQTAQQQATQQPAPDNSSNPDAWGNQDPGVPAQPSDADNSPNNAPDSRGVLSFTLTEITPEFTISSTLQVSEGLIGVVYTENSKVGFIDENGKIVIEPLYELNSSRDIPLFNEDRAFLYNSSTNETVLITTSGSIITTYPDDHFGARMQNSRAIVRFPVYGLSNVDTYYVLNENGFILDNLLYEDRGNEGRTSYSFLGNYACDRVVFRKDYSLPEPSAPGVPPPPVLRFETTSSYAIYDKQGQIIKELFDVYDVAHEYSDGLLVMRNAGGLFGAIDVNGNTVLDFTYEELGQPNEGLIPFMRYGTWGYIDYNGNEVIERKYESAGRFNDGLAIVRLDRTFGVIDTSGEIVIPNEYRKIDEFNEYGFAYAVRSRDATGHPGHLIDKQGNILLNMGNYSYTLGYIGGKFLYDSGVNTRKLYKIAELP